MRSNPCQWASLIVSPHANHLHGFLGLVNLVDQPMLDVNAAGRRKRSRGGYVRESVRVRKDAQYPRQPWLDLRRNLTCKERVVSVSLGFGRGGMGVAERAKPFFHLG